MKLFILIFIIIIIFMTFRLIKKMQNSESLNKKEDIIDLEKDPRTNEYKPKE